MINVISLFHAVLLFSNSVESFLEFALIFPECPMLSFIT